jgi:hypothetical protein
MSGDVKGVRTLEECLITSIFLICRSWAIETYFLCMRIVLTGDPHWFLLLFPCWDSMHLVDRRRGCCGIGRRCRWSIILTNVSGKTKKCSPYSSGHFFYWILSLFTFQMLSLFHVSLSKNPYPIPPTPTSKRVLPTHPLTPIFLTWHSPNWGIKHPQAKSLSPHWHQQGLPLPHKQLEPYVLFDLWSSPREVQRSGWLILLLPPWSCKPFNSFIPFSNSSTGDPALSPMIGCKHPPLYLSGSGRASQETVISGSHHQTLLSIHNSHKIWWLYMGWLISTYQWVHTGYVFCDWVTLLRMIFSSSIHWPGNFIKSLFSIAH